tara:strand:- start:8996 stop:10867 length:1872 start_codon:yes stop_codon:yes gene_type:complete
MAAKFGLLIDAKTKGENNIKRLGNSMQGVEGKAKNLGMAVRGVGAAFKGLFAAAAVAGFAAYVKGAINTADAFGKLSTRTGIAADKLQAYVNAGKLADVSQSEIENGLRKLAQTQAEAAEGVKTYSEAYAKLGISVKKADGSLKPSDQLLGEIADKFEDLPNGPEKAAVAMDIFGRSGSKLITLLNGGSEALERFNYETSENFARNAEFFNDQIQILAFQFDGFRQQLADFLLPTLNSIILAFSEILSSENDMTGMFQALDVVIKGTAVSIAATAMGIVEIVEATKSLAKILGSLAMEDFGEAFKAGQEFFTGVGGRFDFNKRIMDMLTGRVEAPATPNKAFTPLQTIQLQGGGGAGAASSAQGAIGRGLGRVGQVMEMLDALKEENRLLNASLIGKREEVELEIKIEEMTRGLTPELAAHVEQQIRGNAALQDKLDKQEEEKRNQDELNKKITESQKLFEQVKDTVATGLTNAIMGLIDGTKSLSQSLSGVLRQVGSMFLQFGIRSLLPFAKGGVFAQNNVVPFAYGGVVNRPTLFPMANGMGLMGEAGPEGILPLRRGRSGRLGVEASGSGATTVNVSVDASGSSVQGDSAQASQLGKAIGVAVQTEILKQKRPGGLLATV